MEYRTLGRSDLEVGVIGLGTEHLVASRDNMDAVFDLAAEEGVNCIDLLYNDPVDAHADFWKALTPAVRKHRDSLICLLHWGFIYHEPIENCQRCFEQALDRLGGYAEVALLTMVDSLTVWNGWAQESIERLRDYQRDGRVGFIGISSHNAGVARTAVESELIDVLMFPVNIYEQVDNPERQALLETCAASDVGVVAMKPYYGGRLLTTVDRPTGITPAQCLHYVLSQPVTTAVPGAHNADQMRQALHYNDASTEEKHFVPVHDELKSRLRGQCVRCQHCLPCPEEIPIPDIIYRLDYVAFYGGTQIRELHRELYNALPVKASSCSECGICLERCPFEVDIIGKMNQAAEVFETS